jgi:chromosome segregation ATPase
VLTKDELQEQNDELRLALEQTRESAERELGELRLDAEDLREEVSALREELGASESRRRQLQSELDTLNETSNNARELYREKEERLLAGVRDASEEAAAAYQRWEEQEAHLRGELATRDSTISGQQRKLDVQRKQLQQQGVWMVDVKGRLKAAEDNLSIQSQTISVQESRIARHDREMQRAVKRSRSILIGLLELMTGSPAFWVFLTCLVGILAGLVYMVNSILDWLRPAPSLLGQ